MSEQHQQTQCSREVLQTPLSFIHSFIKTLILCENILTTPLLKNYESWEPEILRECSSPPICHMSHVICHTSHVTCHMSHVTCHMSCVTCHLIFFDKVVEPSGGRSVINWATAFSLFKKKHHSIGPINSDAPTTLPPLQFTVHYTVYTILYIDLQWAGGTGFSSKEN